MIRLQRFFMVITTLVFCCLCVGNMAAFAQGSGNALDFDSADDHVFIGDIVQDNYSLSQNYPNPFNPTTEISFGLPKAEAVKLSVYNTSGQLIRTLVNGFRSAGYHQAKWNGTDESGSRVTSGMYVYVLQAGEVVLRSKMLLMK